MRRDLCVIVDGIAFAIRVPDAVPEDVAARAAHLYARAARGRAVPDEAARRRLVSECVCGAFADLRGMEYANAPDDGPKK